MTLLKRIALMVPVLRKGRLCEACGASFACEISLASGCWCSEVTVSKNTGQGLRAKYRNCLCRACLEMAELKSKVEVPGTVDDSGMS